MFNRAVSWMSICKYLYQNIFSRINTDLGSILNYTIISKECPTREQSQSFGIIISSQIPSKFF